MSMYTPEIKEELSEEAKMLVEDGGKVYRVGIPKNSSEYHIIKYSSDDNTFTCDDIIYELGVIDFFEKVYLLLDCGKYVNVSGALQLDDNNIMIDTYEKNSIIIDKVNKRIFAD